MNILHKITLRSLLRNKTRTLVTIIGVILSAAMITAVTTFISSLQGYMYNNVVYQSGDWHGVYYGMDSEQLAQLQASEAVELSYAAQVLGYAELEGGSNEDKPYLYLLAGDADFFQHMPVHVTAGRLPQNADEILIPQHVSENGGVRFTLGSSITLAVGQRVLREGTAYDDTPLQQHNPYQQDEELLVQTQRSYTIVGFYERPDFEDYSAPGYTVLTCMEAADTAGASYDGYFRLNNPREIYSDSLFDGQFSALASSINRDLLMMSGYSRYDSFYRVVYSLAAILIGLIMFGSISLIYNAFAISVSERTRQFGLLSSVGATRRQIRRSVFFEALVVSLVGIPLGILSGILGIGVTLHYVGGKFGSLFGASGISLSLHVSVAAVIIAAIVALVTVLISAWVPSKRAMRISAIEAIRQSNDISIKAKKVRTSKLTYKLFGLEGMIARKHFKRNRKKYRATVVSLFMSVVLFISASSFCTYMTDAVSGVFETYDYDIQYYTFGNSQEEEAEIFALLCSAEGVTQSNWYYYPWLWHRRAGGFAER